MSFGKMAVVCLAVSATAGFSSGDSVTCGDLRQLYDNKNCTRHLAEPLSRAPVAAACPYNFTKPACKKAEPQSPRDLTSGAVGALTPKATTLSEAQAEFLPLVNVHYHLGAEHRSEDYSNATDSQAYDTRGLARRLSNGTSSPRPGFMCATVGLTAEELVPYAFKYCKGQVEVGKSYEVHYVHSSAGYSREDLAGADFDGIDDGLGGAANGRGMLNPMIVVQAQVFQVVNGGQDVEDMLHGWTVVNHSNSVMYAGSTTGQSHDNEVCSPYAITWHVDKSCHKVAPAAFDNLCKQMKEVYKLKKDLHPHGSRKLLSSQYVVKAEYVKPLASGSTPQFHASKDGAARAGPAWILVCFQVISLWSLSPALYRVVARA
mmetsp:Transcript_38172/g.95783  ORF Transcript_38172/g.95783 Transcript_38172/m.95783 type:complete len:374 (+) Transcript_38172:73-1194(+)